MNITSDSLKQRTVRGAVALGAATLLVAGAAWHGLAAAPGPQRPDGAAPAAQAQQAQAARVSVAGGRDSYADIVKKVAPAVVTIQIEGKARVSPTQFDPDDQDMPEMFRRFFDGQSGRGQRQASPRSSRQRALGSGVVVTSDGYILTNNHVVDSADDIRVEFTDGRSFKAKLVGADKPSDLALLKIAQTGLATLPLGNSDAVQVGDVVLAVGNPLGIGQTVTMGIISAKGRSTGAGDGYEDFLQTDAPINHGNSGGALVSTKGELVGINSQIMSTSDGNIGIGFAIPANMAHHVMDQLRTDGRVHRSQLGVTVQPVTSDMAESLGLKDVGGAIVSSVASGSAAERAGIRRGDVIQSFDGQPIHDFNALRNKVADSAPGSNATVVVVRDGSERTLNVKLDEASVSLEAQERMQGAPDDKASLGVAVAPLTPDAAARAGLGKAAHGVVVRRVSPDGRAADAGIQAGDIILEVNRQPIQSVDELRAAVRKAAERPTLLLVRRSEGDEGRDLFVTVRPQ